jgi:hypothetical protein
MRKRFFSSLGVATVATAVESTWPGFVTMLIADGMWIGVGSVATTWVHRRQKTGSWK